MSPLLVMSPLLLKDRVAAPGVYLWRGGEDFVPRDSDMPGHLLEHGQPTFPDGVTDTFSYLPLFVCSLLVFSNLFGRCPEHPSAISSKALLAAPTAWPPRLFFRFDPAAGAQRLFS